MRFIPGLPSKEGAYTRTGSRTPMQWSKEKNSGFSKGKETNLYLPLDPDKKRPDVLSQEKNSGSLLNFTRRLIELRNTIPALRNDGDIKVLSIEGASYTLVYQRSMGNKKYLIALNPSSKKAEFQLKIKVNSFELIMGSGVKLLSGLKASVKISGQSYAIFKIEQ